MEEHSPDVYHHSDSVAYYKSEFGEEYFQESFHDVWENCVVESVKSIFFSVYKPIIFNIFFGLVVSFGLPEILFHWLSALCGIYMLLTTIQSTVGLMVVFSSIILAYFILIIYGLAHSRKTRKESFTYENITCSNDNSNIVDASVIQYLLIVIFVLFEYIILAKETWLEIRGIMMVFSMKLISLVTDLPSVKFPTFREYFGYMFCSGNVLFGPWMSFEHYLLQANFPTKKNFLWVFGIIRALLYSVAFLSISNCWASYFIQDDSNILILGYKEALSFRTSHYFICYLSEAFMLAAGWKELNHHFDDQFWNFRVSDFLKIELPTSLSLVVVNWNRPMHEFLKKYIYKKWLPLGKFRAVLLTFVISSLFHGFELKVSTVLISLGILSYLQILVREHISETFDICVSVHPCKSCHHKFKRDSIICKLALLGFSFFTVLHLIYLGVLMDQSTEEVGIYQKWNDLYFFSLWVMFINFLIVK